MTIYQQEANLLRALFAEKSKVSQRKFAEQNGLGTAANFGHYITGRRPMNAKIATAIAAGLGCQVADFSPRLAKEIEALQTGNLTLLDRKEIRRKRIPLVSSVHAGAATDSGDLIPDEYVEAFGEHPTGSFALHVEGDSMTPVFDGGDIVVVDPTRAPKIGCYVVARSEIAGLPEATLKQYFEVDFDEEGRTIYELRPLNPAYPTLHSIRHKMHILGVVAELIKRF